MLCRRVLWFVISVMNSGAGFVESGVGRVSGMCVAWRFFGLVVVAGGVMRLA